VRTVPGNPGNLSKLSVFSEKMYRWISRIPYLPSFGRYNISLSHERKFLWFMVAKVGTGTIRKHFNRHGVRFDVESAPLVHYPPNRYKNYFKFAFVRNPWDRLISCWLNKVVSNNLFHFDDALWQKMQELSNFVDFVAGMNIEQCDRHLQAQCTLIDLDCVDFLGRLESFDDDFQKVCNALGVASAEILHKNSSANRKPYQDYYDNKTRENVAHIYRKDIQIFGYQF
jgi:hypothetical protein